MMKLLMTVCFAAIAAVPTMAHPGHDHAGVAGGQWHHLLWLGAGALVIFGVARYRWPNRDALPQRRAAAATTQGPPA